MTPQGGNVDPETLHPTIDRSTRDPECVRGHRCVPPTAIEQRQKFRSLSVRSLIDIDCTTLLESEHLVRRAQGRFGRRAVLGQCKCTEHELSQLAHVSGPALMFKPPSRRGSHTSFGVAVRKPKEVHHE